MTHSFSATSESQPLQTLQQYQELNYYYEPFQKHIMIITLILIGHLETLNFNSEMGLDDYHIDYNNNTSASNDNNDHMPSIPSIPSQLPMIDANVMARQVDPEFPMVTPI